MKQEARRKKKIEQKKVERKSLDKRDGLEDVPFPPLLGGGRGVNRACLSPSPPPRKYHGKCVEKRLKQATCVNRILIAKALFILPCLSTLLLTLKQLVQLCGRSDIPGCAIRKLKLKTEK